MRVLLEPTRIDSAGPPPALGSAIVLDRERIIAAAARGSSRS
jgi:hypothetical protein